jgi:hypothetical protein
MAWGMALRRLTRRGLMSGSGPLSDINAWSSACPKADTSELAPAIKWPARHGVFFGTSLWLGFPRGAVEANGEAVGETFFLTAFGFFFSRLLLFWPFATVSSYGFWSPARDRFHDPYSSTARRMASMLMQLCDMRCLLADLSNPSHPCRLAWPESQNPSSAFRQPSLPL